MTPEQAELILKRKAGFVPFYKALMPTLVEFVERLGISHSHLVLKNAEEFAPYISDALQDLVVHNDPERTRLLMRVGYFIGEYFSQKYGGCWYLDDIERSRYFSRYVVGRFSKLLDNSCMIDPFEIAKDFVDSSSPRGLCNLLASVEKELLDCVRKSVN